MKLFNEKMIIIIGIYSIASPTGRIYIGQARNINRRKNNYKKLQCKTQTKLYRSLKKYGWENHVFEIIHICSESELDELEMFYIRKYNSVISGLNLMSGRTNGNHSEESKKKISIGLKGKPKSEQARKNMLIARRKRKTEISDETRKRLSESHKGQIAWNKGMPHSKETRQKISQANSGENHFLFGKHHTEETIEKIRKGNQGKIIPQERIEKIRKTLTGKKQSEESKRKKSESLKRAYAEGRRKSWNLGICHSEETKMKMRKPKTKKKDIDI